MHLTLRQLQREVKVWSDHNFDTSNHYHPMLGMTEELGELCHAMLKHEQKIRELADDAQYTKAAMDALGDLLVYMADFCNRNNFDLQDAIETTWATVKQRDWRVNPVDGS